MPEKFNIKYNREKLSTALIISNDINNLKDSLLSLRLTSGVGGVVLSAVRGCTGNKIEPAQLIMELEEKITKREQDFKIEQVIVKRMIENLKLDKKEEELLKYRYVECRQWKDVSVLMGLSKTHSHRLENSILSKVKI